MYLGKESILWNDLFDIAQASALVAMKIIENKNFFILQRQKGCPGCVLGTDVKLAGTDNRKQYMRVQEEPCLSKSEGIMLNCIYFIIYLLDIDINTTIVFFFNSSWI